MIEEKDIKVGATFCWDGERIEMKDSGFYLHLFDVSSGDFCYTFSNKSKYPTSFTIVGIDELDNVECAINDGETSIVMDKGDIMRSATLADVKAKELHKGSLSVPLKVEFGESTLALHHAEDVATMRHALLEILKWFKTKHRELPFILEDPFNDDICNTLLGVIVEFMTDEKEKEEEKR
jgi:hypothetical protein